MGSNVDPTLTSINGRDLVFDIGGGNLKDSLRAMLQTRMLNKGAAQTVLPSALLSDDKGSRLWRDITRLENYYQTKEEIALLEEYGDELADLIRDGTVLIDLGCGDTRKVRPLLESLEKKSKRVKYFGLDLSCETLAQDMAILAARNFKFVECRGLWGTFEDALRWVQALGDATGPRWFLSLGSILGNDFLEPAVTYLKRWSEIMRPDDRMLLGMDGTIEEDRIKASYHDEGGVFEQFLRGGLEHANRVLGYNWYRPDDWEVDCRMVSDEYRMHKFLFKAKTEVRCGGRVFPPGHRIDCYEAFKLEPEEMAPRFQLAGLNQDRIFNLKPSGIYEYLLSKQTTEV